MPDAPREIEDLIGLMARLPGLGPRSARRAVLALLKKRAGLMAPLAQAMANVALNARDCPVCGNIATGDLCPICADPRRATGTLCVVEDLSDLGALERAGLTVDDIDVIESNEAFAAQACAVAKELNFPPEKVNPNGSGISLGHAVGATGSVITVKAMYELERIGGRYALITMCIGGGQGIAMVIERCA